MTIACLTTPDFGLAKAAPAVAAPDRTDAGPADPPAATLSTATQADVILGTAAYMAPEQAKGQVVWLGEG